MQPLSMPIHPSWGDLAIRLILTMIAGACIGFNRGARGHAAGLRTTMLVGLAAAVAMIQTNILLTVVGKTPASFSVMDVMRLPLGILTGVGFIGGGAILRRGDLITGVTTAATLWVMTAIGLCFGGGQIDLGVAGTLLALIVLWALRWVDIRIPREQRARLVVSADPASFSHASIAELLAPLGCTAQFRGQRQSEDATHTRLSFDIRWKRAEVDAVPLDLPQVVGARYPVLLFEMTSGGRP